MPRRPAARIRGGRKKSKTKLEEELRLEVQLEGLNLANDISKGCYEIQEKESIIDTGFSQANWRVAHMNAPEHTIGSKDRKIPANQPAWRPLALGRAKISTIAPYIVYNNVDYVPILDSGGKHFKNPSFFKFVDRGIRRGLAAHRRSPFRRKGQPLPLINKRYR